MKFKPLQAFDFIIIGCVLALTAMGVTYIYSAGIDANGVSQNNEYIKQIVWASVGFIMMIVFSLIDYRRIKKLLKFIGPMLLALLIYTPFFGATLNNARSWIKFGSVFLQPSEFGKLIFTLFLAWYLEKSKKENQIKRFIFSTLIMIVPVGLILMQPDFGTAMVYIPIFLFMCLIAGIPVRYILAVFSVGMLTIFFTVLPVWQEQIYQKPVEIIKLLTNTKLYMVMVASLLIVTMAGFLGMIFLKKSYFYWITYAAGILLLGLLGYKVGSKALKPYQISRLIIFINPEIDPQDAGWHIINSQIAIGSGGFRGKGFLLGTQSHYKYLPEQSTDFIFSILAEESGFVGCMVVFASFLVILLRIIGTMRKTNDSFGLYICAGALGMFFFHFMENVGMVMGTMPITGIPLPFVSYGGSTYLTNAATLGIIMSVRARKNEFSQVY